MNNSSVTDTCKKEWLFCRDLPSKPLPHVGTILVTGASGHVGGRLVPELLARGYKVRVMLRGRNIVYKSRWTGAEIVIADVLNEKHLKTVLDGIDTAYYLIHSMRLGSKGFEAADIKASANFGKAAEKKDVKRIIYLASLLTPIPNSITRCLVEGLKNEAICHDESIKKYFPFEPISYKEAVLRTIPPEKKYNVSV